MTPRPGLGVIEQVLITTLHGFGVSEDVAVLGVIGYRLVNFWLPVPIGDIGGFLYHLDSGAIEEADQV